MLTSICSICCNHFCFLDNVRAVGERANDMTIDTLNPVVSSRGRHVVPSLSYWMGE